MRLIDKRQEHMVNDTDMELVNLAIGGDECAFENLIQKHYLPVFHLSFKWCRVKEDAEEITQEIFIKLGRKLNSFNHRSCFKTWLYRIVINTAKDYTRKSTTSRLYESAIAASLTAVNADATARYSSSSKQQKGIPGNSTHILKQPQNKPLPPGIYRSTPYLSIVIVPESVDPAFVRKLGVSRLFDDCVILPDTHLEPYRPDR
jgi:RNA polymerase sigma factor (sigma-70 family)